MLESYLMRWQNACDIFFKVKTGLVLVLANGRLDNLFQRPEGVSGLLQMVKFNN